ncbi:MAG: hypothetical protein JW395_1031 [Nitrospira sp.]|nr:hypothetical protein [Nitrospira sp.]
MSVTNTTTTVSREERGALIAAKTKLRKNGKGWIVPSQSGNGEYLVDPEQHTCTCPDFVQRGVTCKHQVAVTFTIERETRKDGTVKETRSVRVTYSQEWSSYNAAQTHEGERFLQLLHSLCEGVEQPPQGNGRPRLPLADVVFALALRSYLTVSGRRATSFVRDAERQGLIDRVPSFQSAFRYLESADLTALLKSLIEESAKPLKAVETDFAADSTGFATAVYQRWFDHKWGKIRSEHTWVKAHLICGVKTNIVTAAEVHATETADAPQLPALVNKTAQTFNIQEVSADKAYSSRKNLHVVEAVGGVAYIPFKAGTNGMGRNFDGLWNRMWHFYNFNQGAFFDHYHKRSNVETTMSMIKAKFGTSVRAKTPVAQVNEVLLKILCHNLVVLVSSFYELGVEAVFFGTSETELPLVPNVRALNDF